MRTVAAVATASQLRGLTMRFTFIPPQMQSQVTPTSLSQLQAAGVCEVGRGGPWRPPERLAERRRNVDLKSEVLQNLPSGCDTSAPATTTEIEDSQSKIWSGARDLNPGPHGPEPCALPNCASPRL